MASSSHANLNSTHVTALNQKKLFVLGSQWVVPYRSRRLRHISHNKRATVDTRVLIPVFRRSPQSPTMSLDAESGEELARLYGNQVRSRGYTHGTGWTVVGLPTNTCTPRFLVQLVQ